jgi:hypothetical protein
MIKIGESREFQKKPSLAWREWKKQEGKYLLVALFGPGKYNSWTISFDVGEALIRKTIPEETGREIFRKYRGFEGSLFVIVSKVSDIWEFWLEEESGDGWFYNAEGRNLIRRKDDIPF